MNLGDLQLDVVRAGEFWLDGGAMFGVVPRVIWERLTPPDSSNRIRLQTNCMLVRGDDAVVLVDTGIGDKEDERFRKRFRVDESGDLVAISIPVSPIDFANATSRAGLASEDRPHHALRWRRAGPWVSGVASASSASRSLSSLTLACARSARVRHASM